MGEYDGMRSNVNKGFLRGLPVSLIDFMGTTLQNTQKRITITL